MYPPRETVASLSIDEWLALTGFQTGFRRSFLEAKPRHKAFRGVYFWCAILCPSLFTGFQTGSGQTLFLQKCRDIP